MKPEIAGFGMLHGEQIVVGFAFSGEHFESTIHREHTKRMGCAFLLFFPTPKIIEVSPMIFI